MGLTTMQRDCAACDSFEIFVSRRGASERGTVKTPVELFGLNVEPLIEAPVDADSLLLGNNIVHTNYTTATWDHRVKPLHLIGRAVYHINNYTLHCMNNASQRKKIITLLYTTIEVFHGVSHDCKRPLELLR